MQYSMWKKGLVLTISILFIGLSTFPSTGKITGNKNIIEEITAPLEIDICYDNLQNQDKITTQFKLIKLFVYINGTGETEKDLDVFDDEWRLGLKFKFINEDADMKIGFFGIPLWKILPLVFNPTGPHRFMATLFYGSVNKTGNISNIEGYCLGIHWGK